jgi:hypothetical protein
MNKILFLFLFFSTITFSQTIRYEGNVIDDAKAPLEMANVMAVNQAKPSTLTQSPTIKGNLC